VYGLTLLNKSDASIIEHVKAHALLLLFKVNFNAEKLIGRMKQIEAAQNKKYLTALSNRSHQLRPA